MMRAWPTRWAPRAGLWHASRRPEEGDEPRRREPPPFGVPPSEEGRSGNLGPPPPDLLRDLTGRGGEDEPPPYRVSGDGPRRRRRWWPRLLIGVVALLVVALVLDVAIGLYVDRLWFDEVGYRGVFNTRIGTQVWLFFAAFGIAFVFVLLNVLVAWRLPLDTRSGPNSPFRELSLDAVRRGAFWAAVVVALLLGLIFGSVAAGHWEDILQFIHAEPFGIRDAEFDKDASFYVFKLEPLQFIKGWAVGVSIIGLLASAAVYGFRYVLHGGDVDTSQAARVHIAVMLAIVVGLFVWGYWLARFELALSDNGVVQGATYTDAHVRSVALLVLMAIGSLAVVALLSWPFHRRIVAPGGALGLLAAASIGGTMVYPAVVQEFTVEPNELEREEPYIQRNIEATRYAFRLDTVEEREFPAFPQATVADIEMSPEVLRNTRLWDHRPLRDTLNNIQTLRQLYAFADVDVDRYDINGEARQVFLGVRELSHDNLQADQQGWVNRRLQFTHGFGVTVTPVDEVSTSGRPNFFLSNIPPELSANVDPETSTLPEITEPRVYFGELTDPYVIVNSDSEEFDFPIGSEGRETTRYAGTGGIPLGGFFKRAAFAWELGDRNILVSGSVSGDSRIVFRRNVQDRVHELAPFLALDRDPYVVVGQDGRLYWIQDAYTTTDRFPYSQPLTLASTGIPGGSNYVRNSVKVVIDAFNGTVDLYIVDESDPIIAVWAKIFPDLFQPQSAFPADLREHWRYPEDLFLVQSEQYLAYHITDPDTLYNREDVWAVPTEVLREQTVPVEPYYVTLRLPDEAEEEFLLIQPFTPRNRLNAVAWLAGRSDGEHYGRLFAFRFPSARLVDGPAQVEARIDADVSASRQFTLLGQQGSDLIRGNLLFLPLGQSYVYVEPVFVEAESSSLPLLQAVVVVNGETVALEETLDEAARVALGLAEPTGLTFVGAVSPEEAPVRPPPETATPDEEEDGEAPETPPPAEVEAGDLAGLVAEAQSAFDEAQRRLAASDFAGYGEQLERLRQALARLDAAINSP